MRRSATSMARAILAACARRYGDRSWDLLLRATAAVSLAAIPATVLSSDWGAFAGLALFMMWTNGPYSPVLPAVSEPVLMLYGWFYSPLLVGLVGTLAIVVVETINYRIYGWAGRLESVRALRDRASVRRLTRAFGRRPFPTVVIGGIGVLPLWIVRALAAFEGYPLSRYLTAAALGRLPRLILISTLGVSLAIPSTWLAGIAASVIVVAVTLGAWRLVRWRLPRTRCVHVGGGMPTSLTR
jgi:uncharacterized membrane protein YdjX (TVP38/TMEM64 family)